MCIIINTVDDKIINKKCETSDEAHALIDELFKAYHEKNNPHKGEKNPNEAKKTV
jgi:hypothetical protein